MEVLLVSEHRYVQLKYRSAEVLQLSDVSSVLDRFVQLIHGEHCIR